MGCTRRSTDDGAETAAMGKGRLMAETRATPKDQEPSANSRWGGARSADPVPQACKATRTTRTPSPHAPTRHTRLPTTSAIPPSSQEAPGAHCNAVSNPLTAQVLRVYHVHGARHWRQSGHTSAAVRERWPGHWRRTRWTKIQCNPADILKALWGGSIQAGLSFNQPFL